MRGRGPSGRIGAVRRPASLVLAGLAGLAAALPGAPAPAQAPPAEERLDEGRIVFVEGADDVAVVGRETPAGVVLARVGRTGPLADLAVPPFTSVARATALQLGRGGRPVLTLEGCRGTACGTWAVDVRAQTARRLRLPRPARGCEQEDAQVDGRRTYVVRFGPDRCRPGLYEVVRGRAVRRMAGDLGGLRIARGLAMWVEAEPTVSVVLRARRLGERRSRVLYTDGGPGFDTSVDFDVQAGRPVFVLRRGRSFLDGEETLWHLVAPRGDGATCSRVLSRGAGTWAWAHVDPATMLVTVAPEPGACD
jgi:hypothetical protein